jgi:hypothetical protein
MNVKQLLLLILIFSFNLGISQNSIYIDEKGDTVRKRFFEKKWRNKELGLIRWDSMVSKKKRICKLKKELYQKTKLNYDYLKEELENIINFQVKDSTIILIEFFYKNDLCTVERDSTWTKEEILKRKIFLEPIKMDLNNRGIFFICLFEKGAVLKGQFSDRNEYFFIDKNNYFKSNLFLKKALCGSYAIIKPNGETLVRNGENRADSMAIHLEPSIWSQFFKEESNDKN